MLIEEIKNAHIVSIEKIFDYTQIAFNSFGMNIYNPFIVEYNGRVLEDLTALLGKVISEVEIVDGQFFRVELDNKYSITISLDDNHFTGPEAIEIRFDSGVTLII